MGWQCTAVGMAEVLRLVPSRQRRSGRCRQRKCLQAAAPGPHLARPRHEQARVLDVGGVGEVRKGEQDLQRGVERQGKNGA